MEATLYRVRACSLAIALSFSFPVSLAISLHTQNAHSNLAEHTAGTACIWNTVTGQHSGKKLTFHFVFHSFSARTFCVCLSRNLSLFLAIFLWVSLSLDIVFPFFFSHPRNFPSVSLALSRNLSPVCSLSLSHDLSPSLTFCLSFACFLSFPLSLATFLSLSGMLHRRFRV